MDNNAPIGTRTRSKVKQATSLDQRIHVIKVYWEREMLMYLNAFMQATCREEREMWYYFWIKARSHLLNEIERVTKWSNEHASE